MTLTGTTTSSQSRAERKDNEGELHIQQNSKTGALPSDAFKWHI